MPMPPDGVNKDGGETGPRRSLLGAGATVGGLTMLSRVLGLARDIVIATIFGARPEADAFFVAFRIPNLFRRLFAEGAFSQGFVPVLSEYRARRSRAEVRTLVGHVAGLLGLALLALTVVGMLGAEYVVALFAPGFEAEAGGAGRAVLAADMLRITFPYLLLISLTALCGGVLNSYGHFAVPAFTPVWLNVCLILAAVGLAPQLERPVMALAWGVLLAGIVQLAFQFPVLARHQLLALPRPSMRDEGVRRVWKLMLPAAFGASVGQLNLLVDTLLASFLGAGSIAWLYYADRLMELPLGVFAIALSTVLLPGLSREHALADGARFSRLLDAGLKLGLLLTVPAAVALVVLAVPLIATLFGHGAMGGDDVLASARALQAYAFGLLGFTGVKILAPGFFARQDTRTPVRIAVVAMGVNVALNLALIVPLAHVGLALATSVAACVNAALLLRGLRRDGVFTPGGGWAGFLLRLGGSSAVLAACLALLAPGDDAWLAAPLELRVLWLSGLVVGGVGLYFGVLALVGYGPRRLLGLMGPGSDR
jgi:putative peptidoglycan lipid II flippase